MLDHVNDSVEQAQQLADLLADKKRLSYVNLIPYNKVRDMTNMNVVEKNA